MVPTVTNTATNGNIHASILGYGLVNPPGGMVISSNGIITWMPGQNQSPGTNTIVTVVTNSDPLDTVNPQLTATNSFTVVVQEVNTAPVLPVQSNQTLVGLSSLLVTNRATNGNIHASIAGYSLTGPGGATISGNGIISRTPTLARCPAPICLRRW